MSLENRSELPTGYIWKECGSIKAKFPMPQDWFFKTQTVPGTRAFFMTREPIIADSLRLFSVGREMLYQTSSPEGYFKTGLSINVFPDFYRRTRRSPSAVARDYMDNPSKEMIPTSQILRQRDGHLITLRRLFRVNAQNVMGKRMESTNYYIEFTANDSTQTLYTIMFETPSENWQGDEEIARTMIENRVLDKTI